VTPTFVSPPGLPGPSRSPLRGFTRWLGTRDWLLRGAPVITRTDRQLRRWTGNRIGLGEIGGASLALLTVAGRKTGLPRTTPVFYTVHAGGFVVVGSNWGRRGHPEWSANLLAAQRATVAVRSKTYHVRIQHAVGEERARLWQVLLEAWPGFHLESDIADGREFRIFFLVPIEDDALPSAVRPVAANKRPALLGALPPGPRESPIRQLAEMGARPFDFLDRCRCEFGDVFTVRPFGQETMVFFGDEETIRWIFTRSSEAFTHYNDMVGLFIGEHSVLFLDGADHRQERRMLMPAFHGDRMRAYGDIMRDATDHEAAEWSNGAAVEIRPHLQRITMDVICRCLFGAADGPRHKRLRDAVERFVDAAMTPALYVASSLIPPQRIRRYFDRRSAAAESGRLAAVANRVVPQRRLARHRAAISEAVYEEIALRRGDSAVNDADILAMLLSTRDDDGFGLSDREIHDEVLTLLVAGHETTATTLAWALHHITNAPAVGDRLYQELNAAFPDGVVAPERIRDLAYLQAVVNETLRLTPTAVAVPRRLTEPTSLAGYDLSAGTVIAASIYVAHRSERNWDRPDDFDPARFLTGRASPFAFLPFGGGPRRCVGAEFARYQIAIVLAQLWLQWRFESVAEFRVRPVMRGVTVAPSPRMPLLAYRR
jgi:cytochrome P450 family 110